jgi:hypothetical protein
MGTERILCEDDISLDNTADAIRNANTGVIHICKV